MQSTELLPTDQELESNSRVGRMKIPVLSVLVFAAQQVLTPQSLECIRSFGNPYGGASYGLADTLST